MKTRRFAAAVVSAAMALAPAAVFAEENDAVDPGMNGAANTADYDQLMNTTVTFVYVDQNGNVVGQVSAPWKDLATSSQNSVIDVAQYCPEGYELNYENSSTNRYAQISVLNISTYFEIPVIGAEDPVDPDPVDPDPVDPDPTDPDPVDPDPTDPDPVDPNPTEPNPSNPDPVTPDPEPVPGTNPEVDPGTEDPAQKPDTGKEPTKAATGSVNTALSGSVLWTLLGAESLAGAGLANIVKNRRKK